MTVMRNYIPLEEGEKKRRGKGMGIESEDGTLLTEQSGVMNRWKDSFRGWLEGEVKGQT